MEKVPLGLHEAYNNKKKIYISSKDPKKLTQRNLKVPKWTTTGSK